MQLKDHVMTSLQNGRSSSVFDMDWTGARMRGLTVAEEAGAMNTVASS
jgi:hypothetical protein